jgi:hypothetical protein
LAVIVIPIVRVITPPGISERSTEEKPAIAKSIVVEPAIVKSITAKPASMESATAEATHLVKSAAMEATKSTVKAPATAVETSTTAMRPSEGETRLADRASAQQRRCDCQSPSYPRPGPRFA